MKNFFSLLFLLIIGLGSLSGEIAVKSFRKLESDMTARIDAPKKDQNGDVCAIIKVVTTQTGFIWEPDGLGIVSAENKGAEYWLYVPFGAKRITIKHPQLGVLRDYLYPMGIEKATVYEMVLVTGKVTTIVEETIESQWLMITPEPANALVYINDEFVKTGEYMAKLKPGAYNYRVELPLYHTEAGSVEVGNTKKTLSVKLKPAFGYIKISSQPESGAQVFVNGKLTTGTTPLTTEPIASGEHTVQVVKEMYQPITRKVQVMDGQTIPLDVILQPNFAELTINAPSGASIVLNNQQKGTGSWSGRLSAGIYSIEARLDKHRAAKQDIELTTGDKRTIELQPTPIYGSLDVVSSPSGAAIKINGKDYGTTPYTINKLLIGEYIVQLKKKGFVSTQKSILIKESQVVVINETLPNEVKIKINSNPENAQVLIDGKILGNTPIIYNKVKDIEKITLVKKGYKRYSETISFSQQDFFANLTPKEKFSLFNYFDFGFFTGIGRYADTSTPYLNVPIGLFLSLRYYKWLSYRVEFEQNIYHKNEDSDYRRILDLNNHLIVIGYPFTKKPRYHLEFGFSNTYRNRLKIGETNDGYINSYEDPFKSYLLGLSWGLNQANIGVRYSFGQGDLSYSGLDLIVRFALLSKSFD